MIGGPVSTPELCGRPDRRPGRVSPFEGRKRVRIARDLHAGLSHVRSLLTAGLLSEYKIATIVAATAHLSPDERAEVDRELAEPGIEKLGMRRIHDLSRRIAASIAPEKFAARADRRVSVRPSADGMADLIAHLPSTTRDGIVIGGDSRRRRFRDGLRENARNWTLRRTGTTIVTTTPTGHSYASDVPRLRAG